MKKLTVVFVLWIALFCATGSNASDAHSAQPFSDQTSYLVPVEVQPKPGDITKERAIDMAREIFTFANPISEEEVDKMTVSAVFIYYDEYMRGWEPIWLVKFTSSDMPEGLAHRMLYTYDGLHIDYAKPGEELTTTYLNRWKPWDTTTTVNEDRLGFFDWTIEEKAAFSQKWIPVMEAYCKENYYYTGKGDIIYFATRYVYGLPSQGDIPLDEATVIAEKAAMKHGATESMLARRTAAIYFDITDPDAPLWKFWLRRVHDDETMGWQEDDLPSYFIQINARTGEVVSVDTSNAPYGRY